jgi:phosphatidylglycerol:prolipoprotein diacylglycerol transferase
VAIYGFLRSRRDELGLTARMVCDLSILVAAGVLVGGRLVEVVFYEWPFYRDHLHLIPAYWLGGMATHGLLLGAIAGILICCRIHRRPFLVMADALAVPAAFILGFGRIGNFIDGLIVGSPTDAWWGVKFPDAEGFRHPVVLYDAIKNLLLVPLLLLVCRLRLAPGAVTGLFLFAYAGLRIFVDLFREYPTTLLGLATGQILNITMSLGGLALLVWSVTRRGGAPEAVREGENAPPPKQRTDGAGWRPAVLAAIVAFSLVIPSDWTQDVPDRYGKRHPGLRHSALYPAIAGASPAKPPPVTAIAAPRRLAQ